MEANFNTLMSYLFLFQLIIGGTSLLSQLDIYCWTILNLWSTGMKFSTTSEERLNILKNLRVRYGNTVPQFQISH